MLVVEEIEEDEFDMFLRKTGAIGKAFIILRGDEGLSKERNKEIP